MLGGRLQPQFPFTNPLFLALKAALATHLAILLGSVLGNPDKVTASFIAVVCISPTVSMGLRRGAGQFVGSVLGGAFASVALFLGAPLWLGVPLAVGAAVHAAFLSGLPSGYIAAAFAALFVQAVPFGTPEATLAVRLSAVGIGALSGLVINFAISGAFYGHLFDTRLVRAEALVRRVLREAVETGPQAVGIGFPALGALLEEAEQARKELVARHARAAERVGQIIGRVESLRFLLHLVFDLAWEQHRHAVSAERIAPLLGWLLAPQGEPGEVPAEMSATRERLVALRPLLIELWASERPARKR